VNKFKLILAVALLALIVSTGWQLASCELANYELQDDLKDIASQAGARIGMARPSSDDELQQAVVARARNHDIQIDPAQVTVRRSGTEEAPVIFLTVNYTAKIGLPGCSVIFHFHTTSGKSS